MNTQSLTSFSKISQEMEKLTMLISKEEEFKQNIKNALMNASQSDSEDSQLQNIDLYFQQCNNPTTKSLPFDPQPQFSSQNMEGDSETIGTIYRNNPIEFQEEGDKDCNPDDKSTVILAALKNVENKEKSEQEPVFLPSASIPNYSSLDNNPKTFQNEVSLKTKKSSSKNATTSNPSEARSRDHHYKSQNHFNKNSSIVKGNPKIESPVMGLAKKKQAYYHEDQLDRDLRVKNTKVSKIDREELTKLQQKKILKKSEASSNRKKTKRNLVTTKSTSNMPRNDKFTLSGNYVSQKSYGNSCSKKLESSKSKRNAKKDQKYLINHQDWLRMQKSNKKLNRVNIYKFQENMKKGYDKKHNWDPSSNKVEKKSKKTPKFESHHKNKEELKLHFTDNEDDTTMKKIIQEKELSKQYNKQTNKYLQVARKMSKQYFETLIKECREASEEAILKINLVTLVIYFFDQFTDTYLLSHQRFHPNDNLFDDIPEQEIIQVLLHPKKIIKIIEHLPTILMQDNIMSAQRIQVFLSKFNQINEQLDQELEFFLLKKEILYSFIHMLSEYIKFLIQKDLVAQTKRSKVLAISSNEPLHGFYSGRSKREDISKKQLKKKENGNKLGFRCDSDRKITLEDQDFCFKEISKNSRKEPNHKSAQLKKLFK